MLKVLFAFSFSALVFLVIFGAIKKNVKPNEQIQARIMGIQNMDVDGTSNAGEWTLSRQDSKKAKKLEDMPFRDRVLIPAKRYIAEKMLKVTPKSIHDFIAYQMVLAGKKGQSVGAFVFTMAIMGVAAGFFVFYLMIHSDKAVVQKMVITALSVGFGLMLPILKLRGDIKKRQGKIRRQMPEMLDLLCVSVEAGLSFDAALRKIVERMKGPLIDECSKMLDDVRMGVTRREAMQGIAYRCDVQEVSLFVTSVLQAERLGSNMSNTLSIQAENVRERHRQYVKAMALKAPVKIVLPLVGFILPAIFIVALGPALFNISKNFMK